LACVCHSAHESRTSGAREQSEVDWPAARPALTGHMNADLQAIVDRAYKTFSKYRVSGQLDVCTVCCVTKDEERKLLALDVRSIPQELLYTWNHAAKSDSPDLTEFKHFLPRILDLIAQFDWPAHSIELCLKSFRYYQDTDWSPEEKQVVGDFARTFFSLCVETRYCILKETPVAFLIMFDAADVDLRAMLKIWEVSESVVAAMHFSNQLGFDGPTTRNAFATEEFKRRLEAWLTDYQVQFHFSEVLEAAVLDDGFSHPEFDRSYLSQAYEIIQLSLRYGSSAQSQSP
jgi:hypothetical protein